MIIGKYNYKYFKDGEAVMRNRVKELRWEKNWSQATLSKYSGVRRSTIAAIEGNVNMNPTVLKALLLAKALDAPVETIFILY